MTKTVKTLIIINIAVFILTHLLSRFPWFLIFGMVPALLVSKLMLWQLFTYMFLHVGLWHLVLNMLMLWFFGPAIEAAWGRKQFLFYYFFTGIGAALCSLLTSFGSQTVVVGASGAIFAILVAYALMFPESVILLFFIFPMKMKQAVFVLAGINLLGAISAPNSGIAYFAHLGGGLFGYLYLKSEWLRLKVSYFSLTNLKSWWAKKSELGRKSEEENLSRQVDLILDKISKEGLQSLTKRERKILERKSRQSSS